MEPRRMVSPGKPRRAGAVLDRDLFSRLRAALVYAGVFALGAFLATEFNRGASTSAAAPRAISGDARRSSSDTVSSSCEYPRRGSSWQTLMMDIGGVAVSEVARAETIIPAVAQSAVSLNLGAASRFSTASGPSQKVLTFVSGATHLVAYVDAEACTVSIDMHTPPDVDVYNFVDGLMKAFRVTWNHVWWKAFQRSYFTGDSDPASFFYSKDLETQCLNSEGNIRRRRLINTQSQYQNIQVWEVDDNEPIKPGKPLSRILYLDGVQQSSTADEKLYHEHLIHPAMLAHPSGAKRVAILGGGEGASLREVLKHKTVTEAYMIELDGGVVDASKEHLKQLNNCSFGQPGYKNCFEDPRTRLVLEDCVGWFRKRFNGNACDSKPSPESKFDVIILDLLDPEYKPDSEFAKYLYSEAQISELSCSLNDDGVFVAQLGESPSPGQDVKEEGTNVEFEFKIGIVKTVAKHFSQFGTFVYALFVPSFKAPWTYVIGCKSAECARRWNSNPAAIDLAKLQRLLPETVYNTDYSGADHLAIQQIPQTWLDVYCAHHKVNGDTPPSCKWLESRAQAERFAAEPESFWGLRHTTVTEAVKGGGSVNRSEVYAARDIAKGEELGLYDAATSIVVDADTLEAMRDLAERSGSHELRAAVRWMDRQGRSCGGVHGGLHQVSSRSLLSLASRACGGEEAANVEARVGKMVPDSWDPVVMRRSREFCASTLATAAVRKGAQLVGECPNK